MSKMNNPVNEGLQPLVERLEKSHYNVIVGLCEAARKQANKLHELEIRMAASQYVNLCSRLADEIELYIRDRKTELIPYTYTLFEKSQAGHDCTNCGSGGSCTLQHDIKLKELKDSHIQLNDIIHRLQMVALPLYSETIYPEAYIVLRNQMALLENNLAELYLKETTLLIPKIAEAQKKINVRD